MDSNVLMLARRISTSGSNSNSNSGSSSSNNSSSNSTSAAAKEEDSPSPASSVLLEADFIKKLANSGGREAASFPIRFQHQHLQQQQIGVKKKTAQQCQEEDSAAKTFSASLAGEKYLLLNQVEGSSLYRCVDIDTSEEYVCKIVTRDSISLVSAHYRLDDEPRISAPREVLIGAHSMYLVFPRAHGDLHSYVRQRKRLRESEARRLFRQVAETVRACHREGIVLRDLKLRKFIFADPHRAEIKLESLEDAIVLEEPELDLLHDKRGCPAYVSPEILRAGAQYSGKAADMWSLGVILYTMLVGRYPFNDSEHANLFAKISRGHFIIPDFISSKARCLIRALLRKEPSERITAEDVLLHPFLTREDTDWQSRTCDQLVPQLYQD